MIAPEVITEIKQLLAEGRFSQRKIARMTGVSRSTVGAIAKGKRRDPVRKVTEESVPSGPPARCPGCGGYVYLPCHLCYVREKMARKKLRRVPDRPLEPMRVELTGESRERYQRVHARRRLLGEPIPPPSCEEEHPHAN